MTNSYSSVCCSVLTEAAPTFNIYRLGIMVRNEIIVFKLFFLSGRLQQTLNQTLTPVIEINNACLFSVAISYNIISVRVLWFVPVREPLKILWRLTTVFRFFFLVHNHSNDLMRNVLFFKIVLGEHRSIFGDTIVPYICLLLQNSLVL